MSKYGVYSLGWRWLVLVAGLILCLSFGSEASETPVKLLALCNKFSELNTSIRDGSIEKPPAKKQFRALIEAIRGECHASGVGEYSVGDWVFPLGGYGYKAIGGIRGNGYQKGGYDYFAGNKHSGHPSQDIFIRDKKQSGIDVLTNKPVRVLSLTGGVVVAAEKVWSAGSLLRGGRYVWIYDPTSNGLIYYAHNSKVLVDVGDVVTPGEIIAEVGRTGLNAYKRRSASHLHLTYLSIVNGLPVPRNIFRELLSSRLM